MSMHNYIYMQPNMRSPMPQQTHKIIVYIWHFLYQEVIAVPVLLEKHSSSWCSRLTTLQFPTCKVLATMCVNTCQ